MIQTPQNTFRPFTGLVVLRLVLVFIMLTHSLHRMYAGTVGNFGEFLNAHNFNPLGVQIAWSITVFELIGALLLAFGLWQRVVSFGFIGMLFAGIIMVHAPRWFVVGAGSNGMEYSIALIAGFIAVAFPPKDN
jgi:putative oxidoreductase